MTLIRRIGLLAAAALAVATPALGAGTTYTVGPVTDLSASCSGQNAEVEQAADQKLGYVYEDWMGCHGIAFARSTDGGRSFEAPISLPGTVGSNYNVWDPSIAVGADGIVYGAFMRSKNSQWYPVVRRSTPPATSTPSGTQRERTTTSAWLSYSTDHGAHWSTRVRVRTFSINRGFLTEPLQVSPEFGDTSVWPGDTFGLSSLGPNDVVLSWGSATTSSKGKSDIFSAHVGVQHHLGARTPHTCRVPKRMATVGSKSHPVRSSGPGLPSTVTSPARSARGSQRRQ